MAIPKRVDSKIDGWHWVSVLAIVLAWNHGKNENKIVYMLVIYPVKMEYLSILFPWIANKTGAQPNYFTFKLRAVNYECVCVSLTLCECVWRLFVSRSALFVCDERIRRWNKMENTMDSKCNAIEFLCIYVFLPKKFSLSWDKSDFYWLLVFIHRMNNITQFHSFFFVSFVALKVVPFFMLSPLKIVYSVLLFIDIN